MTRFAPRVGISLIAAALCLRLLGDANPHAAPAQIAFPKAMPRTVLWAWEEPEDLRTANPQSIGVAYLAETLLLTDAPTVRPRHQPLTVAPDSAVMAVVRIETGPGFRDSLALRSQTAAALAEVTHRPGLRALQVDFDATHSERDFYSAILHELRPQMPPAMPLSITALVSWCTADRGPNDWLASLPIDEAVPMYFRLGGHARPYDNKSGYEIREPLCRTSIGLSTDESWPPDAMQPAMQTRSHRTYLFSPRPWQPAQLTAAASPEPRPAALRIGDDPTHAFTSIHDTGLHPRHTPEDQP